MSLSGFKFDKRTTCPFRYDAYGHRCNLKIIDGTRKEGDIFCGLTVDLKVKEIPIDCPLKEGAVTIGLIQRGYQDSKDLAKKVHNMLSAYVDMIHEAKEKQDDTKAGE